MVEQSKVLKLFIYILLSPFSCSQVAWVSKLKGEQPIFPASNAVCPRLEG